MRLTPDTNVLVRAAVPARDATTEDAVPSAQARAVLRTAELVAITLPTLCEFVWVLRGVYRYTRQEIRSAVEALCSATSVTCDRSAVAAGLSGLAEGGDFADGVIAVAGVAMGGDVFMRFDRTAVRILRHTGRDARLADEEAGSAHG